MVSKRKKKKAVHIKPVTLKVMAVGSFTTAIPRVIHRINLKQCYIMHD